jgi:hypothetical protein
MSEQGGRERGAARLIRTDQFVRPVLSTGALANDNRRRLERGSVSLARAVVGTAPCHRPLSRSAPTAPRRPEPSPPDPSLALAVGWLGQNLALWTSGVGAACRLPPVASGLALWRACSELGFVGVASCASLAASGVELVGVTIAGVLGAATRRRGSPASS